MRPKRLGRIASRARGGWSPVAGCGRGGVGTCRGVTCLSLSGRRSRWPGRRVSRCGRSPRGWGAPRRRSRGSWAATPSRRGGIGRPARMRRPGCAPRGRNRRSWRRTWRCGARLSSICRSGTRRSRSPAGCGREFPDDPEMWVCNRDDLSVAVCAVARRAAPGADPVSAHRAGAAPPRPSARAAEEPHPEHGQHLLNVRLRPRTARFLGIGRAI